MASWRGGDGIPPACRVQPPGRDAVPDDAVMSASTWVPLVTAAAGLIAGLATGLGSTLLARRWSREDRAAQWQREDSLRWQQDRLQVYARLISALEAWDGELNEALKPRITGKAAGGPLPFDAAEWERRDKAVSGLLALVQLMAPEQVTGPARDCYMAFILFGLNYLASADVDTAEMFTEGHKVAQAIRVLVEAMKADLGLDGGRPAQ
jgi:hypothetical protein